MKQRPGDQPLPTPNANPDIQSMVIDDIGKRRAVGIERYGTPLQPFNGRNTLRDIYEELLDAACYVRQRLVEEDLVDKYVDENRRLRKEISDLEAQLSRTKEYYQGRIERLERRIAELTQRVPDGGDVINITNGLGDVLRQGTTDSSG
jgi:hypothetical protein